MSEVLITGGAGFIGLHLARRLASEGRKVDLLDNFSRGKRDADLETATSEGSIRLVQGDLLDPAFAGSLGDQYDLIFHFAAIVGVQDVAIRPYEVLDTNVALTVAAISLARRQRKLSRFIFASTSEVYAGTLEHFTLPIPTPESTPLAMSALGRPRTSYMLSKIYGEALCLHSGLPVIVIRPHNFYGPRMGMSHVIPQLLERGHRTPAGGTLDVYSVEHTRTFCYIDDAVEMIVRLADNPGAEGATVNIGTEEPELAIGQLAETVITALGKPLTVVPRPPAEGSPARRAPDVSLCTELTAYQSQTPVEKGVALTYSWYKDRIFDA